MIKKMRERKPIKSNKRSIELYKYKIVVHKEELYTCESNRTRGTTKDNYIDVVL